MAFECAALTVARPDHVVVAVRNAAGLADMTLLVATVIGGSLSWTVSLAYTVYCAAAIGLHTTYLWSWPALAATNHTATVLALVSLATGLLAMTAWGAQDRT